MDQNVRPIDYSVHCSYKHITGATKGIEEFMSKVARIYVKLLQENKLTEEDKIKIFKTMQELHDILIELQDIAWDIFKMEIKIEEKNINKLLIMMGTLTNYRTRLENLLAEWIRFLKDKNLPESEIGSHFLELHEVLADLYKIEQDHLPELITHKNLKK